MNDFRAGDIDNDSNLLSGDLRPNEQAGLTSSDTNALTGVGGIANFDDDSFEDTAAIVIGNEGDDDLALGSDTVVGGDGSVALNGASGDDSLNVSGALIFQSDGEVDIFLNGALVGTGGGILNVASTLDDGSGGDGDDQLNGGRDNDLLFSVDDSFIGGGGDDFLNGGVAIDGGSGDDDIFGLVEFASSILNDVVFDPQY